MNLILCFIILKGYFRNEEDLFKKKKETKKLQKKLLIQKDG